VLFSGFQQSNSFLRFKDEFGPVFFLWMLDVVLQSKVQLCLRFFDECYVGEIDGAWVEVLTTSGFSVVNIQSLTTLQNSLEKHLPNKMTVQQIHF